jgi:Uma2 family endonuclease
MATPSTPELSRGSARCPLSFEDWELLDEDEEGELVDGFLEEEEVSSFINELVTATLLAILVEWLRPRGGFVGGSDAKYKATPRRGRKADLAVYLPGRRPEPRGIITTPPDVIVEIVSPTPRDQRRDRVEKLADYAAFGAHYYWIVDPELRAFEILELVDGRYAHTIGVSEGVIEPVPGCDGLRIDVDAIWSEVDRLVAEGEGR